MIQSERGITEEKKEGKHRRGESEYETGGEEEKRALLNPMRGA